MEPIICLHCLQVIETPYRKTFLGFRQYSCAACGGTSVYPLPPLYQQIYLGVTVVVGLLVVAALLQGRIVVPGLLCVAGVIGLIRNRTFQRQVDAAQDAFLKSREKHD